MSSAMLDRVIYQLRARAEADPGFADALQHLADASPSDPFAAVDADVRVAARIINRQRQAAGMTALRVRSLSTAEVVDLLDSVSDRRGVDRRRRRGTMLGIRDGNRTLHPAWQFDHRRRDTYYGLDRLITALRRVSADDIDIDAIATVARTELDGNSIADLLADGEVELAVQVANLAGDQS